MKNLQHIDLPWFEIYHTLNCGQVFRFFGAKDGSFVVVSSDKWCHLTQCDNSVIIQTDTPEYFASYFDIDTDYNHIEKILSQHQELTVPISFCKGLRILRQDLVETIISFVISANNRIERIKKSLNLMCQNFGTRIAIDSCELGDSLYTFPSLDTLSKITANDWRSFGTGFRANYLVETTNQLCNSSILKELGDSDYDSAYKKLLSLKGIGPKVANCIALFGLQHKSSFPVDTWIFKSLRSQELDTTKKVHDYYANRYGQYGGYAQQYIFYYNRELGRKTTRQQANL